MYEPPGREAGSRSPEPQLGAAAAARLVLPRAVDLRPLRARVRRLHELRRARAAVRRAARPLVAAQPPRDQSLMPIRAARARTSGLTKRRQLPRNLPGP